METPAGAPSYRRMDIRHSTGKCTVCPHPDSLQCWFLNSSIFILSIVTVTLLRMVCSSYIVDTVTDSYRSSCQAEKSNAPFVNFSVPTRCWTYDELSAGVGLCWCQSIRNERGLSGRLIFHCRPTVWSIGITRIQLRWMGLEQSWFCLIRQSNRFLSVLFIFESNLDRENEDRKSF